MIVRQFVNTPAKLSNMTPESPLANTHQLMPARSLLTETVVPTQCKLYKRITDNSIKTFNVGTH